MLHVVTAVTRPKNLGLIAESLANACKSSECDLTWHWKHDWMREHVGGQKLKNDALDEITDGWVWFIDDDTLAAPDIPHLVYTRDQDASIDGIVVCQQRADGRLLVAAPEYAVRGHIDIGQAILRRSAIGDARIPEDYDGDGLFLEPLLARLNIEYLSVVASYHNALAA